MPFVAPVNRMKQKMEAGETAVGMIVRIMRGVEIAAIAKSAGFDGFYSDLEHCSFSADISRTLETGALGVIVPHVETRAEVEAARFPPLGFLMNAATATAASFR